MTRQQKYTVTINGETKTIAEWVAIGKSSVSGPTVYARIANGMEPIEALLTPREGRGAPRRSVEINGEVKTIAEWLHHFGVTESRYKSRRAAGWDMISAITYPDETSKRYTAFGMTLTAREWSERHECKVSFGTLRSRLFRGKSIEVALTTPLRLQRSPKRTQAPDEPKPEPKPPKPKVASSAMPPALKEAIARIAPATTPELCTIRGVTPSTVRDWEKRGWIRQIDDAPIRWRLK